MGRMSALQWTLHAQAKMRQYRLSPARVRRVLHAPKRVEEGVAPKTVAAMQPASLKTFGSKPASGADNGAKTAGSAARQDSWSQEIWVMVEDMPDGARKVISAWRYPGVSKPRAMAFLRKEYQEFTADHSDKKRTR
jgi:hypothetical protein